MKNVLIIYPHWHPVNLAGVHRPRLIGNFLPEHGWHPIILTVKQEFFEEKPDYDFEKTFRDHYEVYRVDAFKVGKIRLVGDIGLRAFFQLYKEAKRIIKSKKVDFIWIPIPSFYTALLGRLLYRKTKTPYGIDYIDPWVRNIMNQNNWRAKMSQYVAKILEPYAIKRASLITGVSTPYYEPVLKRNFKQNPVHAGMPYGFDPNDHEVVLKDLELPWGSQPDCKPWIYAGAFLPNSHLFLQSFFESIAELKTEGQWDESIRLYFVGTGSYPAKRITAYAKDYGLDNIVIEHRERFSFLHILNFLSNAHRVMLFGSTEKHYTASKTFQCLLSKRPLFSMLHAESSAVEVIRNAGADCFLLPYKDSDTRSHLVNQLKPLIINFQKDLDWDVDLKSLDAYTSKQSAKVLVEGMDKVLKQNE
ncbi:hypothetical protein [Flavobacteriaceae bacterium 14752]|uniref:hypothetical protein n=1 Tax=Mesohalobacter salilacus TaxID=2491711 RepID=UPI000F63ACC4|nr:hypothetical protein EIG84_01570 [Flavobacteriaceae bacterium 14752]